MEYFHKLNIAHRDIKPENLFLDDNFNIKVGDFGLSNQFGSDTLLNTSCGSPCYAAPEMISNKPYSGITVDIWASGVVLFAMLCGYLPFNYPEDQTTLLFSEIKKGNYKIPPFVSKEARHLIKNILNIDNRTRYSVEQIKSHPWYQIHWNYHYKLPGVVVSLQKIPVDEVILAKVKEFNYDPEVVRKDLLENRHNPNTSLYYLLLISEKRKGFLTDADIASVNFVPELIQTFKTGPAVELPSDSPRRPITAAAQNVSAPSLREDQILKAQNQKQSPATKPDDKGSRIKEFSQSLKGLGLPIQTPQALSQSPHMNPAPTTPQNWSHPQQPPSQNFQIPVVQPNPYSKIEPTPVLPMSNNISPDAKTGIELYTYQTSTTQTSSIVQQVPNLPLNTRPVTAAQNPPQTDSGQNTKRSTNPNIYSKIDGNPVVPHTSSQSSQQMNSSPNQAEQLKTQALSSSARVLPYSLIRPSAPPHSGSTDRSSTEIILRAKQSSEATIKLDKPINVDRITPKTVNADSQAGQTSREEFQYRSLAELKGGKVSAHTNSGKLAQIAKQGREFGSLLGDGMGSATKINSRQSQKFSDSKDPSSLLSSAHKDASVPPLKSSVLAKLEKLAKIAPSLKKPVPPKKLIEEKDKVKDKAKPTAKVSLADNKITKKINSIFQSMHKTVERTRGAQSTSAATNRTGDSVSTERKKPTPQAISSLLQKMHEKRPIRGSLYRPSTSGSSTSINRTFQTHGASFMSTDLKSTFLDNARNDPNEISLYQQKPKQRPKASKSPATSDAGYDLLYTKEHQVKSSLSHRVLFDKQKGIHLSRGPVNLACVSTHPPERLYKLLKDVMTQFFSGHELHIEELEHYCLRVKVQAFSLFTRVEAIEVGTEIYTVSIYPEVFPSKQYVQMSNRIFGALKPYF